MADSLADQLLKAGLVDGKKVQQVKKDRKKQQKRQFKSKNRLVDEGKLAAQRTLAEKAEKSRLLNQQREAELQLKAIAAQIKQLIETSAIKREGDIAFNFVDEGRVRKIYVNDKIQNNLSRGNLAIVKLLEAYELVPAAIAQKIAQRDGTYVLWVNEKAEVVDENDPYADYKIPDDLMW